MGVGARLNFIMRLKITYSQFLHPNASLSFPGVMFVGKENIQEKQTYKHKL